jgi:hypothetical protein
MQVPLSPQQRDAIAANPGETLAVIDEFGNAGYYLVPAPAFLHLQGLNEATDRDSHERLRRLIQEGIDSPGVPADEAFERLRRFADALAAGNR